MRTVVSVVSARPNFVKLAAVHHALAARSTEFKHLIVHTGQHYDPLLSDVFFEQLKIPQPNYNLGVPGGDREQVIQATADAFEKVLPEIKPDIVLVYGDVNGAVGGARAAKKLGYKVGHVEAGLRSFDESMPEEHNRIAIDQIADVLFCTEESGMKNLEKEGITREKHLVGNVMIDTLVRMLPLSKNASLPFELPQTFIVATIHRPSNVDRLETLERVLFFLNKVGSKVGPHMSIILPVHPRTRHMIEDSGKGLIGGNIIMIDPLGYLSFMHLLQKSLCVITDSGGIQEEATFLGKRCFTLRKNTERPSTIESGSNVLIDIDKEEDRQKVLDFAKNPKNPHVKVPELWDGKTGERIVDILLKVLV